MTKTPDEIKKGLECCISGDCPEEGCPYYKCQDEMWCGEQKSRDALAYIQQLEAEVRDTKANHQHTIDIAERQKKQIGRLKAVCVKMSQTKGPRWISVEERLPEDGEDVLVLIKYDDDISDTKVAHRVKKKWYRRVAHRVGGVITHWMPLPEPPEK